ncbi:MAG: histidine phosphatase family protein [Gemmatimonadota bacterium]|nr:histidine phosphatase family protein [Gemmatimonadota bacterium]
MLLIRHCQSSGQDPDAPLTEIGRKQAEALARFLSDYPIDMIVSSSYARAQQSIEPFAATVGLPVHLDHRLIERTLSGSPIDNWREVVRDSFGDLELRVSGGESAREVLDRGWAAITELIDGGYRLPIAVTHGNLLSLILNSLDSNFGCDGWESLSNPDVFALKEAIDGRLVFERLWSE